MSQKMAECPLQSGDSRQTRKNGGDLASGPSGEFPNLKRGEPRWVRASPVLACATATSIELAHGFAKCFGISQV